MGSYSMYGFAGGRDLFEKYGRCGFFLLALRVRALLLNAGVRTLPHGCMSVGDLKAVDGKPIAPDLATLLTLT